MGSSHAPALADGRAAARVEDLPRAPASPLPALDRVREAVREACDKNLGVSPTVNVHIEDIHHDD